MVQQHRRGRSWTSTLAVGAALTAAGVLFATSAGTAQGTDLRPQGTDLSGLVRQESAGLDDRNREVSDLRDEVDALTSRVDDETAQLLQTRADELSGPAHLQAVRGPGLTVTLDDAPVDRPLPPGYGPNDVVVHQQDVQAVVNSLWASGAEAMMLMDQRVISTSAVRCVGTTLHLQGRVYSPPYVIRAIGDPQRLQQGLDEEPDVALYRSFVQAVGLIYEVEVGEDLAMPGYEGSIELLHARPPSGDGARPADRDGP